MSKSTISEAEVSQLWDENAAVWTDHVRKGWDAYREYLNNPAFIPFISDVKDQDVLDLGCGEGHNTRILARNGARIVGIDISERMIELARQAEQQESLNIQYEVASFSDLTLFPDDCFDKVVSFMALMDGPDYARVVSEAFRVIRPGGEFSFSVSHPCFVTRGYGWLQNDEGEKAILTVSDYFGREPYIEQWRFSQGPIPEDTQPFIVASFPRTYSEYLNGLVEGGFVITKVDEPRPTEEACQKHPWLRPWREHAAIFAYFGARKPEQSRISEL